MARSPNSFSATTSTVHGASAQISQQHSDEILDDARGLDQEPSYFYRNQGACNPFPLPDLVAERCASRTSQEGQLGHLAQGGEVSAFGIQV